jgi:hypothetical protein
MKHRLMTGRISGRTIVLSGWTLRDPRVLLRDLYPNPCCEDAGLRQQDLQDGAICIGTPLRLLLGSALNPDRRVKGADILSDTRKKSQSKADRCS